MVGVDGIGVTVASEGVGMRTFLVLVGGAVHCVQRITSSVCFAPQMGHCWKADRFRLKSITFVTQASENRPRLYQPSEGMPKASIKRWLWDQTAPGYGRRPDTLKGPSSK